MVVVYVKHYITQEGMVYFEQEWFPKVRAIISKQKGFVSISYDFDEEQKDCVNIKLLFKDQKTLDDWIAYPDHDALIADLDGYRSRSYWEAASSTDDEAKPLTLQWETIIPKI